MILDSIAFQDCIPFIIGDGPSSSGPRIGGAPPEGISSAHTEGAYYLLTVALEEDGSSELSIFLHPDWDNIFADHSRILYSQQEPWVELLVHGPSVRGQQDDTISFLTPHPLQLGSTELDNQGNDLNVFDEPGAPLRQHKLGGKPYYVRYSAKLNDAIQEIVSRGFRQLLQLTFPGPKDADIAGDWPFADGNFYLFCKCDGEQYDWCYGWLF